MQPSRISLLQGMPIFGGIRDDVLEFLLARSTIVSIAEGDFFFREGDAGLSMFVLESGAPRADDLTILRRLSLGLTGTVPSLEEIRMVQRMQAGQKEFDAAAWWTACSANKSET